MRAGRLHAVTNCEKNSPPWKGRSLNRILRDNLLAGIALISLCLLFGQAGNDTLIYLPASLASRHHRYGEWPEYRCQDLPLPAANRRATREQCNHDPVSRRRPPE